MREKDIDLDKEKEGNRARDTAELRKVDMIRRPSAKQRTTTYLVFGLRVGAGINQQPRTDRAIMHSGTHQRRPSVLRESEPTPPTQHQGNKLNESILKEIYIAKREKDISKAEW